MKMRTATKQILVLLVISCFFIRVSKGYGGYSTNGLPYPEPAKCETDDDCYKGRAKCLRRECHCTGYYVGDGKTKCDLWRKCTLFSMYDLSEPCGYYKAFRGRYQHSYCLQGRVENRGETTYRRCKCYDGYFGRANYPQCWNGRVEEHGHGPCLTNHNCHELATCKHNLCYCNDGYVGNGDKCIVGKHGGSKCIKDSHCPEYSYCKEDKCKCKSDLVGNGGTCELAPLLECFNHDFCGANSTCINGKCICKGKTVGGGKECREYQPCPKGKNYCKNSKVCLIDPLFPNTCAALNDCEKQGTYCPRFSTCEKRYGRSPNCVCIRGFKSVRKGQKEACEDIDECKENKHKCPADRVCVNRLGSHDCVCKRGQRPDFDGKCVQLNECDKRGLTCPQKSKCEKIPGGSFDCVCIKGFKSINVGGKLQGCEDINECLTADVRCSGDRCRNNGGSYTCVPCLPGFTENDKGICVAIVKGACNCDDETEECRSGKCRCKTALGYKRNSKGRCVRPQGSIREVRPLSAYSCYVCSHVSIVIIGIFGALFFTT